MIDSHISLIVDKSKYGHKLHFSIEDCLKHMDNARVEKAIVMINPNIKKIFCQKNHKIKFYDTEINGEIIVKCIDCGKEIYKGINPYRELNQRLIEQCTNYKERLFPLLYIPVLPKLSQLENKYFEGKYKGSFIGYKFQPSLSNNKVSILKNFNSNLPVLIHSGRDEISDPTNILKFSKRYKGNIIISHFAKFKKAIFDFANTHSNIYINCSPVSIMYEAIKKTPEKLFDIKYLKEIQNPENLLGEVLTFLNENKLLFGSDYPVSSIEKEKYILDISDISRKQYKKISYLNIVKAYNLEKFLN